jgi:hypothetical protein
MREDAEIVREFEERDDDSSVQNHDTAPSSRFIIQPSRSSLLMKVNKYSHEGEQKPEEWLKHKCHVIVFTYSGKPVYTRYGGEDLIAGFTGTLQAILSKYCVLGIGGRPDDDLQSISMGDLKIVFLDRSPLILVSISRHQNACETVIRRLLKSLYSQLIFVLTNGVNKTLELRPNFDVRSLLGGTKPLLGNLISWMNTGMLSCIRDTAIEALPLPLMTRQSVTRLVQTGIPSCTLLTVLLCGEKLICTAYSESSGVVVSACDLILLINLVTSSNSLKSGESWTPVCLPGISEEGFVYAYVQYFSNDVVYVSLCVDPDNKNFHSLSQHSQQVREILEFSPDIATILEWSQRCPLAIESLSTDSPNLSHLSNVVHCAIVLNQSRQIFSSLIQPNQDQKNIYRNYSQCMSLLEDDNQSSQQVSMVTDDYFVFVWLTSEFQFFLTAPKGIDNTIITHVYHCIRDNEQILFLSNIGQESGTRLNTAVDSLW